MGYLPTDKVIALIAQEREIEAEEIILVSSQEKDWPDGCLGLGGQEEMCTQAIVPGYEIILEIDGQEEIYRTDLNGENVRQDLN